MQTSFNGDFYSAAAQVLPVLFLAVAIEYRLFLVSESDVKQWLAGKELTGDVLLNALGYMSYALTVGLGERAALRALHDGRTLSTTEPFVVGALVASGLVLALAPLEKMLEALHRERPDSPWTQVYLLTSLLLFVAVAAMPIYGVTRVLGA